VAVVQGDKTLKAEDLGAQDACWKALTFTGDKVRAVNVNTGGKEVELHHRFRLDPSRKPKTIDLTDPDDARKQAVLGLYELDGDTLRLCFPSRPGRERPKALEAKERTDTYLLTFKRAPQAPPQPAAPKSGGQSRAAKPAGADKAIQELAKVYALRDEEDLKCIKPPYPAAREAWRRDCWRRVLQDQDDDGLPTNAVFRWDRGEFKHWSSVLGAPGPELAALLPTLATFQPQEIEGDQELLSTRVEADFIVRKRATPEKVVAGLEQILRTEFALPVRLTFRHVERKVYVADGKFRFAPVKGRPAERIELYGRKLTEPKFDTQGSGDFNEFLRGVALFIGKHIVAGRIEDVPTGRLHWHGNQLATFTEAEQQEAHDPASVLRHLSEQTGLTFREETRPVRVLLVERKE
jgi:uncharacterized protein (TIGR03067 family)